VDLGLRGLGRKVHAGDRATPEGRYRIREKREGAATRWYKALVLDYPSAADRRDFRRAKRRGEVPAGRGIGGLIEIHGHGGRETNWTDGCIALRNPDLDRLYAVVDVGTRVTVVGSGRVPGDPQAGSDLRRSPVPPARAERNEGSRIQ
jgi:murein L,D-transpeptidase YafK